MRRPTRPQRPALVASKLIVHPPEPHCKLFFTSFYRHFCVFVWFVYSCIVKQHNDRFFVCWCCRLCELNRRRRVTRFKRRCACGCVVGRFECLRAFLPAYSASNAACAACAALPELPPAAAAALLPAVAACRCRCAAVALPLPPEAALPRCRAACLPPLPLPLPACICARARFLIYARGDRVLKVPRWGGCHLHVQF